MLISRQQYLSGFLTLLVIALVLIGAIHYSREMSHALGRGEFAGQLNAQGISGLRQVTVEYLLFQTERTRQQWLLRHASFAGMLASADFPTAAEQAVLEKLSHRHQELRLLFDHLLEVQSSGAEPSSPLRQETQSRLIAQIMIGTQEMVQLATELSRLSDVKKSEVLQRLYWLVLLLATVAMLGVVVNHVLIQRQVLRPVRLLTANARKIRQGQLGIRNHIRSEHEIGMLAQAFDHMVAQLELTQSALAAQASRLQAANTELESFAYSVSHDLRAPLRAINGFSQKLLSHAAADLDAEGKRLLNIIRDSARRMGKLIEDLLAFSRTGRMALKSESLDMGVLVAGVVAELRALDPERDVEIVLEPLPMAYGDAVLLRQVWVNLLANAWKFTGKCDAPRVAVGGEYQDAVVVYWVRDNGAGFDMRYADKLFGVFQRLHRQDEFEGTGAGLAIAQRIVQRHGGRIWAQGWLGEGAEFRFTLPNAGPVTDRATGSGVARSVSPDQLPRAVELRPPPEFIPPAGSASGIQTKAPNPTQSARGGEWL